MHKTLLTIIGISAIAAPCLNAQEISMFNGRDLTGWKGLSEFWSVQDGAITGRFGAGKVPKSNTFLVWQGGEVADFEFSCKYQLLPDNPAGKANSGVQFRAKPPTPDFGLGGYQGEMDPGTLRPKGMTTSLNGSLMDDTRSEVLAASNPKAAESFRARDWTDYRIIAVGPHIQIFVNGLLAVDTNETQSRFTSGWIGLQLHKFSGPNTVQFKDLKLRMIKGAAPTLAGPASGNASVPGSPAPADPN